MKRNEFLRRAANLYDNGKIDADAYDAMVFNADAFCDDDDDERFPSSYAEIEYVDPDTPEAALGMRFDDLNYLRHFER